MPLSARDRLSDAAPVRSMVALGWRCRLFYAAVVDYRRLLMAPDGDAGL